MLPELDGLDGGFPAATGEHHAHAVHNGAVRLHRIELADAPLHHAAALEHIDERWKPTSSLHRAGRLAVTADNPAARRRGTGAR